MVDLTLPDERNTVVEERVLGALFASILFKRLRER